MKKLTIKLFGIFFIIASFILCIGGFLMNHNSTGNRYGSMRGYGEDLIYYANHNIYRYHPERGSTLLEKNVEPYFSLENDQLYYIKKHQIICKDLKTNTIVSTNDSSSDTTIPKSSSSTQLSKDERAILALLKEEDSSYPIVLTENDMAYVKYFGGTSHIAMYQVERDNDGTIVNLQKQENIVPHSNKHHILWNVKTISIIFVIPIFCFLLGVILLRKTRNIGHLKQNQYKN